MGWTFPFGSRADRNFSSTVWRLMGAATVYIFIAMPGQSVPGIFTSPARDVDP
jgi:hypothetical protein